jgi:hypothetical protein
MGKVSHENISGIVEDLAGTSSHKVSDGTHTGYGSSRSLAEAAYQDGRDSGRTNISYNVNPKDDWFGIWNHSGDSVESESDSSDSSCFISSACVVACGLADDCDELRTLRSFRDEYVLGLPNGRHLVNTYYAVAPRIVAAIDATKDRRKHYRSIYADLVLPCVQFIKSRRFEEAFLHYQTVTERLSKELLSNHSVS